MLGIYIIYILYVILYVIHRNTYVIMVLQCYFLLTHMFQGNEVGSRSSSDV